MGRTRSILRPLVLVASLALTGCSTGDDVKDAADGLGLQAGDDGATDPPLPEPSEAPPAAPLDTLVEDLTTADGTARAYMNYLQLGKSSDLCDLFTPEATEKFFTTKDTCVATVNQYAESVLYTFQDSLNVAENLTVRVNSETASTADVGIAVSVNDAEGTSYYDRLDLVKVEDEWRISSSEGISPSEQSEDTY